MATCNAPPSQPGMQTPTAAKKTSKARKNLTQDCAILMGSPPKSILEAGDKF